MNKNCTGSATELANLLMHSFTATTAYAEVARVWIRRVRG